MTNENTADTIRRTLQSTWTNEPNNITYESVIVPLYKLLAELANQESVVFGEIDNSDTDLIQALLVTDSNIYYARFQTQRTMVNGAEVSTTVGGYNLRIAPRASVKSCTVTEIGSGYWTHEPTAVEFVVHLPDFDIQLPIRLSGRDHESERNLLRELNSHSH